MPSTKSIYHAKNSATIPVRMQEVRRRHGVAEPNCSSGGGKTRPAPAGDQRFPHRTSTIQGSGREPSGRDAKNREVLMTNHQRLVALAGWLVMGMGGCQGTDAPANPGPGGGSGGRTGSNDAGQMPGAG